MPALLYNYSIEIFAQTYSDARKRVIRKTKLSPDLFPIDCPFSQDDVLNPDYLPGDILPHQIEDYGVGFLKSL